MPLRKLLCAALTLGAVSAFGASTLLLHTRSAAADGGTKLASYIPRAKGSVTFAKDIAPILYQNCASCHRSGQIGPFPLISYEDAKKRATQLTDVTQSRFMPPWHADSHGEFLNERKLTTEQIGLIKQWAADGSPEGPSKSVPAPPKFAAGWMAGTPDTILTASGTFTVPAEGPDIYRCFVIPARASEDRYITAMEVHPGNNAVVHHVIAYLDSSGKAMERQAANKDGQPGYSVGGGLGITPTGAIGGWAPGNFPQRLPAGIGTLLPKGSDVVLQVHYHPTGKVETDQTKIGIFYCKTPVDHRLRVLPVFAALNIPAGDAHYTTHGMLPVSEDVSIQEVMPHMHLLGKTMNIDATLPDKSQKSLVHVPNYDFNWQTTYCFRNPVHLPKQTSVTVTASYDNSTSNARNPHSPPQAVGWGEQTTDEMCIGFVFYTIDREQISKGIVVTDWLDRLSGGLGAGKLRNARRNPGAAAGAQ